MSGAKTGTIIKFFVTFNLKLEFTTKSSALTIVCLRLVQGTWEREKRPSNRPQSYIHRGWYSYIGVRTIHIYRIYSKYPEGIKILEFDLCEPYELWDLVLWKMTTDGKRVRYNQGNISDVAVHWWIRHHVSDFRVCLSNSKTKEKVYKEANVANVEWTQDI